MVRFSRRAVLTGGAAVGTLTLAGLSVPLRASSARVAVNAAGVAIDGYDPTAYHSHAQAQIGDGTHVVEWRAVPWHFADAQQAARFAADPEAFAPQFGGFCTRAMSFKKIVNGDPQVWRLHHGKLYLFAQPVGGEKFDEGADAMIAKAQAYWDSLD